MVVQYCCLVRVLFWPFWRVHTFPLSTFFFFICLWQPQLQQSDQWLNVVRAVRGLSHLHTSPIPLLALVLMVSVCVETAMYYCCSVVPVLCCFTFSLCCVWMFYCCLYTLRLHFYWRLSEASQNTQCSFAKHNGWKAMGASGLAGSSDIAFLRQQLAVWMPISALICFLKPFGRFYFIFFPFSSVIYQYDRFIECNRFR